MGAIELVSDCASIRPWVKPWYRYDRDLRNPFDSLGLRYCPTCQGEEDTDTEAGHRGTMYTHKVMCKRCGRVIQYAVYEHVPLLGAGHGTLQSAALEWVTRPGQDRR